MATAQREYYDVLGVARAATPDEIKKAYRRLARQYHPDLHTGGRKAQMEHKFKELNEAHEVLGNPESRKKYDQHGHRWQEAEAYEKARQQAGAGRGAGPEFTFGEGADFSDVFETFFGRKPRRGTASAFRPSSAQGLATRGEHLETTVRLSLREVLTGASRRIELSEPRPCSTCSGSGRLRGRACPTCHGTGSMTDTRTIDVKIPAGVVHGTRVRVAGKGGPGINGGKRGDLYLNVQIPSEGVFRSEGTDLHASLPVWPWEAALGAEVLAPTLTGPVRVKVPPGSRTDSKLRLKGKGLPSASGRRGDLFFTLQIVMPTPLSDEDRKLFEQLGRGNRRDPRAELLQQADRS